VLRPDVDLELASHRTAERVVRQHSDHGLLDQLVRPGVQQLADSLLAQAARLAGVTVEELAVPLVAGDGESTVTGGFKLAKPSNTSKPRHPLTERENVGPTSSKLPQKSTFNEAKLLPPLSPTKRQKKTSHYDDLESSPSKRQTTSRHHHAMPASERRMLFNEKTNQPAVSAINDVEKSKMDMSLCELSMRDVKSGDMDISILELSMIDMEGMVGQHPIKPRTKTRTKISDTKRKPSVTRSKRTNKQTEAVS